MIDFFRFKDGKDPKFCIKEETKTYENGNVEYCLGIGYKVYNYNLEDYTRREFGPFWMKEEKH